MSATSTVLGLACAACAAGLLWWAAKPTLRSLSWRKPRPPMPQPEAAGAIPAPAAPSGLALLQSRRPNWLKVLRADELLQLMDAQPTLEHIFRASRLTRQAWERDLLPALRRYAELVQMLPASEAHHHAHVGGLLAHTLEMVLAALRWRIGRLLPEGAPPEDQAARQDHWTYAVFYGTLLHDIGKVLTDLRVQWVSPSRSEPTVWSPLAGSLVELGAGEYLVGFTPKAQREYAAHGRMGVMLLQHVAPPTALAFLGHEPEALHALTAYLSGEARDGAIAELVRRADQASTRHALAYGSRARFATATARPLIELLMDALKDLLRTGGKLPLNRNGAAGWVYDDSVWFVAKRLADEVREHLKQMAPEEAVPGEAKNDRLFDTWQEYGAIVTHPLTQQAVWYVIVHGEDGGGYQNRLTMLRFPLAKIWDDPSHYPAPMAGRIEVLPGRDQDAPAAAPDRGAAPVRGPLMNVPYASTPRAPMGAARAPAPDPATEPPAVPSDDGDRFLAPEETAKAEARRAAAEAPPPAPVAAPAAATSGLDPVVLPPRTAAGEQVPEVALKFMNWLMQGLRSGTLTFNQSGAPVHFVPQGMALVSPLIFREFARQNPQLCECDPNQPERLGLDVQRALTKTGWHVPADAGKNIHQFAVAGKRGGTRKAKLSAMVLANPVRWVHPVPPPNPALEPFGAEAAAAPVAASPIDAEKP
jgi:integrating conjugative element relaxase (TIGR03760 family)